MIVCALVLAVAGVVLRFDDAHIVEQWRELAAAFDAEGLKASFAVPMAYVKTEDQRAFLREAVSNGHEIMDHACHHGVFYDICRDAAAFEAARELPCVAEVDEKDRFVGFKFDFDRNHPGNCTFRGAITNGVLVVAPEEAKRLRRPNKVFVPSLNRYFGFYDAPDGRIQLRSFYRPPKQIRGIDVPEGELLLCDHRAFTVCEGALRYQAALSRDAFRRCGLPDPRTWIQPGGWEPWVPVDLFRKTYAKEFGYTAADCIPGSGPWNGDPKAADPELARYTFRPGAFFDSPSVTQDGIRKTILAARDAGRGLCFLSHMQPSPKMKGGWREWMSETRALLKWLRENDIPVRTMSAMADHLWGLAWRRRLEVPTEYADFARESKLTARYAFPDFDVECYEQANGPDTVQRVMMAIPKNAKGKCPAVVAPFYFPEAMLGFDPVDGGLESDLVKRGTNLTFYAEISYMSDLARRGYITVSADAYHLTYPGHEIPGWWTWPGVETIRNLFGFSNWSWPRVGERLRADWPEWTGIGKLTFDTRLLVDLLCADRRVDASRIGIIGHSLGGKMAFYAGCLDPRIKVIVASDFGIGWDQTNWNASWYWGDALAEVRAQGFDNSALLAASGGKPFCLIAGKYDTAESGEMVRRVRGYADDPSKFLFVNHATGHRPPRGATEKGYAFLDRHLKGEDK